MRKEQELDLENGCSDLLGADVPAGQRASAILILVMPRIVAQPPLWAPGCNTSVLFCRRQSHMRLVVYCICICVPCRVLYLRSEQHCLWLRNGRGTRKGENGEIGSAQKEG